MPKGVGYGMDKSKDNTKSAELKAAEKIVKKQRKRSEAGFAKGQPAVPITGVN